MNVFAEGVLPVKKEVRGGLIQDAYRSCAEAVELRKVAAFQDLCSCRCKVIWAHDIFEQMFVLWPVSFNRGCAFIHPAPAQRTNRNHAGGFHTGGLAEPIKHLAIQAEPRFSFFGTPIEIHAE